SFAPERPRVSVAALRRDLSGRQRGGKFVSRVQLQLAEDACEVTLNRACGDEEGLGDLAVGEALTGQLRDTAFAGCERVDPGEHDPARAPAGGAKPGAGRSSRPLGTGGVGVVECLAR